MVYVVVKFSFLPSQMHIHILKLVYTILIYLSVWCLDIMDSTLIAHAASEWGHVDFLKLLIEMGQIDINAKDKVRHVTITYEFIP